jgi:60 kDa SS-A/Ro ribonucleoprotein
MASNGFTIADPDDAGMLDVVGFDAAVPQLIADFLTPHEPAS